MDKSCKLSLVILFGLLMPYLLTSHCHAWLNTSFLARTLSGDSRPDIAINDDGTWASFVLIDKSTSSQIAVRIGRLGSNASRTAPVGHASRGIIRLLHAGRFNRDRQIGAMIRKVVTKDSTYLTADFLTVIDGRYETQKTRTHITSARDAAVFDVNWEEPVMLIAEDGYSTSDRLNKLWLLGMGGSRVLIDSSQEPIGFPDGEIDAAGRLHAVWKTGKAIRYAVINCSVKPYKIQHGPMKIGAAAASYGLFNYRPKPYVDDLGPSIAVGKDSLFIAWSVPLAPPFSPPRSDLRLAKLNSDYDLQFVQTLKGLGRLAYHPDIALDKEGNLGILWEEFLGWNFDILFRELSDGSDTPGPVMRVTQDYANSRFPRLITVNGILQALWKEPGSETDKVYFRTLKGEGSRLGEERLTLGVYGAGQRMMEFMFRFIALLIMAAASVLRALPALIAAVFFAVWITARLNPTLNRLQRTLLLLFGCSILHCFKILLPVLYGGGQESIFVSMTGTVLASIVLVSLAFRDKHSWDELKWFGYLSVWVLVDKAAALSPYIQGFFLK